MKSTIIALALLCVAPDAMAGDLYSPDFTAPAGRSLQLDASTNQPSLSGLTLITTLNSKPDRLGYMVQVQGSAADCGDTAGGAVVVALDSGEDGSPVTIVTLAYPSVTGGQGGAMDASGMPHSGRIRVFGKSAACRVAAAQW